MPVPIAHALHSTEQEKSQSILLGVPLEHSQQGHTNFTLLSTAETSSLFNNKSIAISQKSLITYDNQQIATARSTESCTITTMKADNKPDPNNSLASASAKSNCNGNSNNNNNNSHSHSNNKKRKAASNERNSYASHGDQSIVDNAASKSAQTLYRTTHRGSTSNDRKKKRASIDEHAREEYGQTEVPGGNTRKKRVLSSPHTRRQHSKASVINSTNTNHENNSDTDVLMEENKLSSEYQKINGSIPDPAITGSKSFANMKSTNRNTANSTADVVPAGMLNLRINAELKKPKSTLQASTSYSDMNEQTSTVSAELISTEPAPAEPSIQKRVLPSRRRDKTRMIPIEPPLFEPPITPAGEYIVYMANRHMFQKATIDPRRVPAAITNEGLNYSDITQSPSQSWPSSGSSVDSSELSRATQPLSSVTHIEVPIFKPCTVGQFLQEEKKRKMQLLSRALAKAEAEAATEARSSSPPQLSQRAVSTRQKHKDIVHNQHVSLQMAVPTSSSASLTHGRKSTTTSTTLGKIEGVSLDPSQEEILTDEVYEKRHRKQEMAEKKVKNREKEKLRHAMYQQQLVVEKLRHIEINRLVPISAFRSLQKSMEHQPHQHQLSKNGSGSDEQVVQAPISLAAARIMQDDYRRRLLQEAEENLRRYEQLGLGENYSVTSAPTYSSFSRTKNRIASMTSSIGEQKSVYLTDPGGKVPDKQEKKDKPFQKSDSSIVVKSNSGEGRIQKKAKKSNHTPTEDEPIITPTPSDSKPVHPKAKLSNPKKVSSQKSSTLSSTSNVKTEEMLIPPKPITTFIKPGMVAASGGRKSSRVALAFGEKVPMLERVDFDLPSDVFGGLIQERIRVNGLAGIDTRKKDQEAAEMSVASSATVSS